MINLFYSFDNDIQFKFWRMSIFSLHKNIKDKNNLKYIKIFITINNYKYKNKINKFLKLNKIKINCEIIHIKKLFKKTTFLKGDIRRFNELPYMWNFFTVWDKKGFSFFVDNDTLFFVDVFDLLLKLESENNSLDYIYTGSWYPGQNSMNVGRQFNLLKNNFENFDLYKDSFAKSHLAGCFYIINNDLFRQKYKTKDMLFETLNNNINYQYGKNDNYIKVSDETFIILTEYQNESGVTLSDFLNFNIFPSLNFSINEMNKKIKNSSAILHLLYFSDKVSHKMRRELMTNNNFELGWSKMFDKMIESGKDIEDIELLKNNIKMLLEGIYY